MDKGEIKKIISKDVEMASKALLQRSSIYIMAGLGFVVGLAWNDAIQTAVTYLFPSQVNSVFVKFIYAMIITLVLVLISFKLDRKK